MRVTDIVRCEACPVRRMPVFRPFSPAELELVGKLKIGQRIADPENDIIGADADAGVVFTIFEGWAYRYLDYGPDKRQILDLLLPGDLIGLDRVLLGTPSSGVRALTALNLCALDGTKLRRVLAEEPTLASALMAKLARDQRRSDERLALLGQGNGAQRIAYLMLDIHERLKRRGLVNGGCPFPLERRHLASALGISGTHVARSLTNLRAAGLATVANGMLLIHNHERLTAFAGFKADGALGETVLI